MKDQFVNKMFWKFFTSSVLCSLSMAGVNMANSLLVGNTFGENGLFILGAISPICMLYSMISIGIAVGGEVHYASELSKGNEEEAKRIAISVLIMNFCLVAVVSLIGILTIDPMIQLLGCSKDAAIFGEFKRHLMFVYILAPIQFTQASFCNFVHATKPGKAAFSLVAGGVITVISGFIFITQLKIGTIGAVIATNIGALIMEIICVISLVTGENAIKKFGMPSFRLACKSFFTGFATGADYIYQFVIILTFNRLLFSINGETGVAVYGMGESVKGIVIFAVDAIVVAMTPLLSTFYGEHNKGGLKKCMKLSMLWGVLGTLAISLVMVLIARPYCSYAGLSGETLDIGVNALRILLISSVFNAANMVFTSYFQNTDKEKLAYVSVFLQGALLLGSGLLLSKVGFDAFWWAYTISEGSVFIIGIIMIIISEIKMSNPNAKAHVFNTFSETFVGDCEKISDVCERIQEFLELNGAKPKKAYFITLAVDETCRLIAENAEQLTLQLTLTMDEDGYVLHIRDNAAVSFNPFEIIDDDERGMGLQLVKSQASDFYYRQFVGYNTLTIILGEN